MTRSEFLAPLIGQSWEWQSQNCWDFAAHVQRELFGRSLPQVVVPGDLSKRWVLEAIEAHPERGLWQEVVQGPEGIVSAADGALEHAAHSSTRAASAAIRIPGTLAPRCKLGIADSFGKRMATTADTLP